MENQVSLGVSFKFPRNNSVYTVYFKRKREEGSRNKTAILVYYVVGWQSRRFLAKIFCLSKSVFGYFKNKKKVPMTTKYYFFCVLSNLVLYLPWANPNISKVTTFKKIETIR